MIIEDELLMKMSVGSNEIKIFTNPMENSAYPK